MVMAAAAAASASASASEDHELLLNRFMPYGSSQLFLEQSGTPANSSLVPANGSGGSSSGSSSSLVSSSSLRDSHPHTNASRSRSDAAASVIYGSIPDVISLDWPHWGALQTDKPLSQTAGGRRRILVHSWWDLDMNGIESLEEKKKENKDFCKEKNTIAVYREEKSIFSFTFVYKQ